jgi:hypothetical protein
MGQLAGLFALIAGILASGALAAQDQGDLRIWQEFVADLQAGKMEDAACIRPYYPEFLEPMKGYLGQLRGGIAWDKLKAEPEVFRVDNQVHFVISLPYSSDERKLSTPFCLTFIVEKGRWYFQHIETIMIRMDRLGPLPATSFPDVPAERKAWMREEIEISDQVRLFAFLAKEKGKDFAHRKENPVTLEKLAEKEAVVRVVPRWFQLYEAAAHLKPKISAKDYRRLFETIWTDRARNAGWNVEFSYRGDECAFRFIRKAP